jgi:YVTN family beta-propeller protein
LVSATPDGKRVYALSETPAVIVIDTATNSVVATIPIAGQSLQGVGITPDAGHAYVVGSGLNVSGPNSVSVIDTATNNVVANIPVGRAPEQIGVNPTWVRAYVSNAGDNTVSVIDTSTNNVVATIPVGTEPGPIAFTTPDGNSVYVVNLGSNNVSVIDAATNNVVATIPAGTFPGGIAITSTPAPPPPLPPPPEVSCNPRQPLQTCLLTCTCNNQPFCRHNCSCCCHNNPPACLQ